MGSELGALSDLLWKVGTGGCWALSGLPPKAVEIERACKPVDVAEEWRGKTKQMPLFNTANSCHPSSASWDEPLLGTSIASARLLLRQPVRQTWRVSYKKGNLRLQDTKVPDGSDRQPVAEQELEDTGASSLCSLS